MRCRDDPLQAKQRKIWIANRLVLEHIDGSVAGSPGAKRGHERAWFDQRRAAGID